VARALVFCPDCRALPRVSSLSHPECSQEKTRHIVSAVRNSNMTGAFQAEGLVIPFAGFFLVDATLFLALSPSAFFCPCRPCPLLALFGFAPAPASAAT
jgi:hypothetical protein